MANVIVIIILIACVGGACHYIYKSRKRGIKCIGCSCAKSCSGGCANDAKKENLRKEHRIMIR